MAQHHTADKIVGTVKQTVGHLFGMEALEKAGKEQKQRAVADVGKATRQGDRHHRKSSDKGLDEDEVYQQVRRQALMADIERLGGFEKQRFNMNHVKTVERHLPFDKGGFKLKKFDIKPLLNEIRQKGGSQRNLRHVETREKGLLRSIPVTSKDFKLKRMDRKRLCDEIRRGVQLKHLSKDKINDRSAPRLDLLKNMQVLKKHDVLMKEIAGSKPQLKHVKTEDKARPDMLFDKEVHIHHLDMNGLLGEVKQPHSLKHVQVMDKSLPMIEDDTRLKMWDKKSFLNEVRQGTDLKHI